MASSCALSSLSFFFCNKKNGWGGAVETNGEIGQPPAHPSRFGFPSSLHHTAPPFFLPPSLPQHPQTHTHLLLLLLPVRPRPSSRGLAALQLQAHRRHYVHVLARRGARVVEAEALLHLLPQLLPVLGRRVVGCVGWGGGGERGQFRACETRGQEGDNPIRATCMCVCVCVCVCVCGPTGGGKDARRKTHRRCRCARRWSTCWRGSGRCGPCSWRRRGR